MGRESSTFDAGDFAADLGRALLQSHDLAVIVVDSDFVVRSANAVATRVLGPALVVGSPLQSSVHAADVNRLLAHRSGSHAPSARVVLRSASGPDTISGALLVSLVPVPREDGAVLALVGSSAAPYLEREARILRARRWEIVGQLASGVVHDLNGRLSSVTTFSDLMLSEAEPGSQNAEDLAEIKQAGLASAVITRRLDLFAIGYSAGVTECALPKVVRGFERLIRRFMGDAVEIRLELNDSTPTVAAPSIRIEEMLIALLANARDAMPEGGTAWIRVAPGTSSGPDRCAVLEVCDSGAEEVIAPLERVLEPFFSSKPLGVGSGLGLFTVNGIATDLGGRFSLHRSEGLTVARVVLPGLDRSAAADKRGADESATR